MVSDTGLAVCAQIHLCNLREMNLYKINLLRIALYGYYKA